MNTVTSAAYIPKASIASVGAEEPFPDGLGPIGPPSCLQWRAATPPPHDAGAGPFNSRPWTPADWITWWEAFIAASGAFITTWPHAGSHLLHYLDASGEDLILPVDTMLADSAQFREIIGKHSDDRIDEAINRATASGTTQAVTFPIRSEWRGFTFDSTNDRDWYLAVGSANYAITGDITVTPPSPGSSQWTYTIAYQVTVDDRYNWYLGKSTPIAGTTIKDSDLAVLHLAGFAQEFAMHGTSDPISESGTR